ncbi:hypothetical protein [Solirubrum puertoriconensis]|uniref:Uncharacterized protein n=1 Tax=Solirubrum puertoriconensis TaxID=1751427 RepID=A0A9X0HP51_SOLP1|nr:hypothetical protein [Solirubrum puertoriconensis]KUG09535.1 hypothetical protein ASU33_17655 [Solirubrum puertoriconensis]
MDKIVRGIRANRAFYHWLVDCAEALTRQGEWEAALQFCNKAAWHATFCFSGFYAEARLERLLARLRAVTGITPIARIASTKPRRVLHYATALFEVGGHTRLLENWIRHDPDSCHDVLLTRQTEPVPAFITAAAASTHGKVILLDEVSDFEKARQLAGIAAQYDVIVLHHHPDDVVPVLALADAGRQVPVCVLNHGDHRYWPGVSVCDVLLEIRDNLVPVDAERRGIRNFGLLPIPVVPQVVPAGAYEEARAALGIRQEQVMLLSIGAAYKYEPLDERDFFADALTMLKQCPEATLVVVGVAPESELGTRYSHPRLRLVPPTPELAVYHYACDIYLEGYPFSSFTAYLEVAALGKPVCRMYDPPLLNTYLISHYPEPVHYPASRFEWLNQIRNLVQDAEARATAGQNEQRNSRVHAPEAVRQYIKRIYEQAVAAAGNASQNTIPATCFTGANDSYLYRMQYRPTEKAVLHPLTRLSSFLKVWLVSRNLPLLLAQPHLGVRDLLWFVFKSK